MRYCQILAGFVIPLRLRCAAAVAIGPPAAPAGAVNWRSSVDLVSLGERLRSHILRQIGHIGTAALLIYPPDRPDRDGCSTYLSARSGRLLYLSIRQIRQIRQIDGSLVQLVFVRWVSGHQIDEKDPICAGRGSRAHRFEPRGGVRGSHVSLKEKARANGGPDRRSGGAGCYASTSSLTGCPA